MLSQKRMLELDKMTIEEKMKADLNEEERFYILRQRPMFSTISEEEKNESRKKFIKEAPEWFRVKDKEHD